MNSLPPAPPILIIEDNEDDVVLLQRALAIAGLVNPVHVVTNGENALEYLVAVRPGLILLDLYLPRKDGFEVLSWIRAQPDLAAVTVVVITSSDDIRDANRAFALGANSFLIKPADFLRLAEFTQALGGNWLWLGKAAGLSVAA